MLSIKNLFESCLENNYIELPGKIDYKKIGTTLFLQCSDEREDWRRNFDILPVEVEIQGTSMWVPRGVRNAVNRLIDEVELFDIRLIVGYSHGGWLGALLSAVMEVPCVAFGCPKMLFLPSIEAEQAFSLVTVYNNPNDILSHLPPGYKAIGTHVPLRKYTIQTDSLLERLSGHAPNQYRVALQGVYNGNL